LAEKESHIHQGWFECYLLGNFHFWVNSLKPTSGQTFSCHWMLHIHTLVVYCM